MSTQRLMVYRFFINENRLPLLFRQLPHTHITVHCTVIDKASTFVSVSFSGQHKINEETIKSKQFGRFFSWHLENPPALCMCVCV